MRSRSSGTLRVLLQMAKAEEWLKMTGALEILNTARAVAQEV